MVKAGLCILNAYEILPGSQLFYERMKEELSQYGVSLVKQTNADIFSYIDSNGNLTGKKLPYDFILYLDKDAYISFALEERGYRLFNSAKAIYLCDDKMLTHLYLSKAHIKMPRTISGPLNYSSTISLIFIHELEALLPFPFVAKDNFGSLGENVFLITNEKELCDFEEKHKESPRLYQEFITSSFGFDYRVLCVNGKFLTGMKRINKNGDFRSNIARGGIGEKIAIPLAYQKAAEKAAQTLGLDFCGVDLLSGPMGEPILCEVNSNAFIGGIEKATGVNVAAAYAKHIVETQYKAPLERKP